MIIYEGLVRVTNALYDEFCKRYGKIIKKSVVTDFLCRIDDLREVNDDYVGYLHDFVMDNNLWA